MDSEGIPTQEFCAIVVDIVNLAILDVYHKFAYASGDVWSRRNIHGLNTDYLHQFGFSNAHLLVNDFRKFVSNYKVVKVFENCPNSMSYDFFHNIEDLRLPEWTIRIEESYHIIANRLKEIEYRICGVNCNSNIHSSYKPYLNFNRCRKMSTRAKLQHGFHCALYDAYELYFYYKHDFQKFVSPL